MKGERERERGGETPAALLYSLWDQGPEPGSLYLVMCVLRCVHYHLVHTPIPKF